MLGVIYPTNPRYLIGARARNTVGLYYAHLSDFGGHLPEGGGMLDQAALMLDAFRVCNSARAKCRKLREGDN